MFWSKCKAIAAGVLLLAGASSFAADAPQAYVSSVMKQVFGKVEYPKMAKMRHQEGVVQIQITINAKGGVQEAKIEKSSGLQTLDDAALEAVQSVPSFPEPPAGGNVIHGSVRFSAE